MKALRVAEFLAIHREAPPVPFTVLAHAARRCGAYAKALLWREQSYGEEQTEENFSSLMDLYSVLSQQSARGLLKMSVGQPWVR